MDLMQCMIQTGLYIAATCATRSLQKHRRPRPPVSYYQGCCVYVARTHRGSHTQQLAFATACVHSGIPPSHQARDAYSTSSVSPLPLALEARAATRVRDIRDAREAFESRRLLPGGRTRLGGVLRASAKSAVISASSWPPPVPKSPSNGFTVGAWSCGREELFAGVNFCTIIAPRIASMNSLEELQKNC